MICLDYAAVFIITSTTGNGEPPHHAISFKSCLEDAINVADAAEKGSTVPQRKESGILASLPLKGLKYSVFALGSSTYENFCTFGKFCNNAMESLGGQCLAPLALGDELRGQDRAFRNWTKVALLGACEAFDITLPNHVQGQWPFSRTRARKATWIPHSFRTTNNMQGWNFNARLLFFSNHF